MALPPALARKVGPFPVIGWVGIGAAGIGLGLVIRRSFPGDAGEPEPDESADAVPAGSPGFGTGAPYIPVGGAIALPASPPPSDAGNAPPEPDTNLAWSRRAVDYLVAQGYSATLAASAIGKLLNGEQLSAQETALVNIAIGKIGTPPEYIPPPITTQPPPPQPPAPPTPVTPKPTPPPAPAPKPPVQLAPPQVIRRHTVAPGDSLWRIAERYYGSGSSWRRIYDVPANRAVIGANPNLIKPGQQLIIP